MAKIRKRKRLNRKVKRSNPAKKAIFWGWKKKPAWLKEMERRDKRLKRLMTRIVKQSRRIKAKNPRRRRLSKVYKYSFRGGLKSIVQGIRAEGRRKKGKKYPPRFLRRKSKRSHRRRK